MAKATKHKKKTKTVAKAKPSAKKTPKVAAKKASPKAKKAQTKVKNAQTKVKTAVKAKLKTAVKAKAKAKAKAKVKVKAKAKAKAKAKPVAKAKPASKRPAAAKTKPKAKAAAPVSGKKTAKKAVIKVNTLEKAAKAAKASPAPKSAVASGEVKVATPKAPSVKTPKPKKAASSPKAGDHSDHHAAAALPQPTVHLAVGDEAPDFTLPTDGESAPDIRLSDYRGEQNIILYFYPKDDTSGCTKQACSFQNHLEQYQGLGAKVIGVSPDGVKSHAKFRAKYDLQFQLAADEGAGVAQDYGVWVPKSMYGRHYMGIQRTTFLIDKAGKIAAIWPKVAVDGHSDEVLAALRSL